MCILTMLFLISSEAFAQVILDNKFGHNDIQPQGPHYKIEADYGEKRGPNLFQSFSIFNIDKNQDQSATFYGPQSIDNIIVRITGGQQSFLNGTIDSNINNVNLWFINPAGIIFGPDADFQVGGSVFVGTADQIRFADNSVFSAHASTTVSGLTAASPEAFGFLKASPSPLQADHSSLTIPSGRTLSLVGGGLSLSGTTIAGSQGTLSLLSVAGPGDVQITADHSAPLLPSTSRGSIKIDNSSEISPLLEFNIVAGAVEIVDSTISATGSANQLGNISINATNLAINNSSLSTTDANINIQSLTDTSIDVFSMLTADTFLNPEFSSVIVGSRNLLITGGSFIQTSPIGAAKSGGDIHLNVTNKTIMTVQSSIITSSSTTGSAGNVLIDSGDLAIGDGSSINTGSGNIGSAGTINLDVGHDIALYMGSGILSASTSVGDAGAININASSLSIVDGSNITGSVTGQGHGADIAVRTLVGVTISGSDAFQSPDEPNPSQISSSSGGAGDAGIVTISTPELRILDGGRVAASATSDGPGGDVVLTVGTLEVSGTGAASLPSMISSSASGKGPAGTVEISADTTLVSGGGRVVATTSGTGDGGNVRVTGGHITISSTDSSSRASIVSTSTTGPGPAGTISIQASSLDLLSGGRISADTSGTGLGGNIDIRAGSVLVDGAGGAAGSGAITTVSTGTTMALDSPPGDAGSIAITAGQLTVSNGGEVATGASDASGGNIDLRVGNLLYLKDSGITTSVLGGTGNGGNINIDPKILLLDHGVISANAVEGHGGNIDIVADNLIQNPSSSITATSQLGLSGAITISSPDTDVVQRLVAIAATFVDPSQQLSASCASRSGSVESSLVSGGRGGLPADPGRLLLGTYLGDLPPRTGARDSGTKAGKPALVAFNGQSLLYGCGGPAAQ